MSGPTDGDPLAVAERVLENFSSVSLISDEAELLRGCLFALVAIAQQMEEVKPTAT